MNELYNPDERRNPPPTNIDDTERDSEMENYIRQKYQHKAFQKRDTLASPLDSEFTSSKLRGRRSFIKDYAPAPKSSARDSVISTSSQASSLLESMNSHSRSISQNSRDRSSRPPSRAKSTPLTPSNSQPSRVDMSFTSVGVEPPPSAPSLASSSRMTNTAPIPRITTTPVTSTFTPPVVKAPPVVAPPPQKAATAPVVATPAAPPAAPPHPSRALWEDILSLETGVAQAPTNPYQQSAQLAGTMGNMTLGTMPNQQQQQQQQQQFASNMATPFTNGMNAPMMTGSSFASAYSQGSGLGSVNSFSTGMTSASIAPHQGMTSPGMAPNPFTSMLQNPQSNTTPNIQSPFAVQATSPFGLPLSSSPAPMMNGGYGGMQSGTNPFGTQMNGMSGFGMQTQSAGSPSPFGVAQQSTMNFGAGMAPYGQQPSSSPFQQFSNAPAQQPTNMMSFAQGMLPQSQQQQQQQTQMQGFQSGNPFGGMQQPQMQMQMQMQPNMYGQQQQQQQQFGVGGQMGMGGWSG